jgi:hypothetical protein
MNNAATDFEGFSRWFRRLFRQGIATGWVVSQRSAGANMSVDISAGDAGLTTGNVAPWSWTTAVENVAIAAASANNRIDVVVAYVDLSVTNPSTATPNNPGALKFKIVQGTPATVPIIPAEDAIGISVGAGNPFIVLASVSLTSSTTQITNAQITNISNPIALQNVRLWGGSSNFLGHAVPDAADANVALTSRTDGRPNSGELHNPYKFSAYSSSNTTIPASSVPGKVGLHTELFNTGSSFDSSTNYRFIAPVAGFYQFEGAVTAFVANSVLTRAYLYKNGAAVRQGNTGMNASGGNNNVTSNVSGLIELAAGGYIELWVATTQGTASNTISGQATTYLDGHLVSKS